MIASTILLLQLLSLHRNLIECFLIFNKDYFKSAKFVTFV